MTQKKIIVVTVTVDVSWPLLSGFTDLLAENGWEVHLVSSPGSNLERYKRAASVTTHELIMARQPHLWRDAVSLVHWIRLLRKINPTVVYAGTPKASMLAILSGWVTGIKTRIYLVRGMPISTATGLKRRLLAVFERLTIQSSTHTIAVSQSLITEMNRLRLIPASRTVDLIGDGSSNGVDLSVFSSTANDASIGKMREQFGLRETTKVVGFVGRLTKDKGLHELAEAASLLSENYPDLAVVIVGNVEQPDVLDRFGDAEMKGVKVIFTGPVADTSGFYRIFDVFALPTWREGYPNVVLEAQASGVPVITTSAVGAVDSVEHQSTGLIVGVGESQELADAIQLLFEDNNLRKFLVSNALTNVHKKFDRARVQENYLRYICRASGDS